MGAVMQQNVSSCFYPVSTTVAFEETSKKQKINLWAKAVIGKIILCQVGNDNDLKYESMGLSQDMNLMLSGCHIRFFPFDSN